MAADAFQDAARNLSGCKHYSVVLRLPHQPVYKRRLRIPDHNGWVGPCM